MDYDSVVHIVQPAANNIVQIVEHWLPWYDDARPPARWKPNGHNTISTI
jgi:hypothetical protein